MSIISNIIDSDLRGFKVNDEIVVDKNVIGEFIKNSAKLTILNKNHQYDSLEKTYLNITNFGKWYVDNLNNDEESVETDLTLFDLSIKFDEDYEDTFSFPATLGEWANWIGNKVGVPLKGTFLNSDKQLTEKPYLGTNPKYRTAVKIIAKYASGWAEINEDETYSIRWFDNTTINIEDWENFKHGSTTDPVNIIILSTGVTEDNIRYPEQKPTNAHELRIEDDWLVIDRYSISKSIFEQVNGFLYTTITELTLPYGLLRFKVGQKIKTKDIELNEIESYISSHILTWDGGDWNDPNSWTSTLKMDELKETTTKYQYSNSIESRVGKTEINCDKNNKIINMLVEDVDEIEKDITTSKQTSGNPIEVNDAGEYNFESIGIDGKSYQETSTGKNKFINIESATYAGITLTHNSDDSYDIVGTSTSTGNIYFQKDIAIEKAMLKDNTHYIISFNQEIDADKILIVSEFYGNNQWKRRLATSTTSYRIGLCDLTDVDIFRCYIMIKVGQTVNIKGLKIQVEEGQVATDIEPYTGGIPSPNPEYPQKIKSVQGITNEFDFENSVKGSFVNTTIVPNVNWCYNTITNFKIGEIYCTSGGRAIISFFNGDTNISVHDITNKTIVVPTNTTKMYVSTLIENDKFQLEKGPIAHRYVPKGRWLEQITKDEDNNINSALIDMNKPNLFDKNNPNILNAWINNNTAQITANTSTRSFYITCEENTTYTILKKQGEKFRVGFYNSLPSVGITLNNIKVNDNGTSIIANSGSNTYLVVYYYDLIATQNEQEILDSIKIYEGYEPYYEFAEAGDTKDEFLDGELTKRVEKLVLSSSDNWVNDGRRYYTTAYNNLMITPPNNATKAQALCSINIISATDTFEQKSGLAIHPNGSIYISNDVKTLLDNGDKIVLYIVLKEPKTYKLKYEPLKLHKGYNYITLNDDLYPNMEIEYLTDSKFNADLVSRSEWTIENDKITSEVSKKVSVEELDAVVEDVNSTIEQTANDITQEVSGKFKDYSTTTETNAAIKTAVDKESASINLSVTQKINDIQIGGTNLLRGTEKSVSSRTTSGTNQTDVLYRFSDFFNTNYKSKIDTTDGLLVTCSFDWETTGTTGSFIILLMGYPYTGLSRTIAVSANAKKGHSELTTTIKKSANNPTNFTYVGIRRDNMTTSVKISNMKVELGNKATDWSSAPEDKLNNSKFTKAEIIAEINSGVSNVTIDADNININGVVTANNNFKILTDGSMVAKNGEFEGTITATSGNIGGWNIDSTGIQKNSTNYNIALQSQNADGSIKDTDVIQYVYDNKKDDYNYYLLRNGYLYAKNANIQGEIIATSGYIGDWKVENGNLYSDYGNYRIFLQNAKAAGGDTWIFSSQIKNNEGGYDGGFILHANGIIESFKSIISHYSIQSYGNIICGQIEVHNPYPYIDFHWNSNVGTYNEDYTTRIIEREYSVLSFLNASGWANCRGGQWINSSSRLVKKNIEEISEEEAKGLLNIKAVSFDYKNGITNNQRGFIAENVLDEMPDYVIVPKDYDASKFDDTEDDNGNIDITQEVPSLDYSKFVVPLVKLCQIQQKQIDDLIERIKTLESR